MKKNFLLDFLRKANLLRFMVRGGLGRTLLLWFLTLSLAPLLIVSMISYLMSSNALHKEALNKLNSVSSLKRQYINSFFDERISDLNMLSQLSSNVSGLEEIINEYKESETTIAEYADSITYEMFVLSMTLDLENFLEIYDYNDIYLIDLDGNILLSVIDDSVRGTNVFKDKFAGTKFARACEEAMRSGEPRFSDIEIYDPDNPEATGFLVQMMEKAFYEKGRVKKKEKVGIMAIQVPMDRINQIMQASIGASKTGETYLVGKEGDNILMRSGSNPDAFQLPVSTEGTRRWAAREPGISAYTNYRGEKVLGVHHNLSSLETLGVHWGLIAEITESEALASTRSLLFIVFLIVLGTIIIVSVLSIIVAGRIVKPIRQLSGWARRVAIGDLSYEQITSEKNEIGEMSSSFKAVVDSFQAVTDVCETIAIGDVTKTVSIRSDKDSLGRAVNQMRDNLVEVVRQANSISMGDYSGEVAPRDDGDMLGMALQRMTLTLRDAAMVAEEVSTGDYSLEVTIKGEKDMLGKALNQMIARLRGYHEDTQRKITYLNNIPTPVHVIDCNYTVQFINKAGAQLLNRTVEECIGKKCYSLFNTPHCQTGKCRSNSAMGRDAVLTGDTVAHVPGRDIPMRYTSAPQKDRDGNIIGAIEYMVDISDEMRVVEMAEKISRGDYAVKIEKRSDEDRLSDALNRMTDSLREAVDQNMKQNWLKTGQTELNNRMRGELGTGELSRSIIAFLTTYTGAQLGLLYFAERPDLLKLMGSYALAKEKGLRRFKFGQGLVGQSAREKRVIEVTDIPPGTVSIRTGMAEIKPGSVLIIPFSYGGRIIGVIEIASLHPLTDIHREFLMQALENIAIALNSAESRKELKELLAKTQEQAEKLQAQQEELRQSNEELEGQTRALIASETNLQTQQEELRVINEELEERTHLLEKQKAAIEQKNIELMNARNMIEKKARDLEEVSKYKSEFLANMSHELRTPLNSILILSQLLGNNREKNLTDKQVEFSKTIHSSGSDLLNLINEILDLSKIEAGMIDVRVERVRLNEFVNNMARVFKPVAANNNLDFTIDLSQDELPRYIHTDPQRAQQIVKNLLSNAFKFTNEGGVSLQIYRPPTDTELKSKHLRPEKTVAMSVSDTGIGIPAEKQAVIFEAFRQEDGTTSRKYGGTGLGLSISRELVTLLGGEIQLTSKKDKGSTFTLYLPERLEVMAGRERPGAEQGVIAPGLLPPKLQAAPPEKKEEHPKEPPLLLPAEPPDARPQTEIPDDRHNIKPGENPLLIISDDNGLAGMIREVARTRDFKSLIARDGETGLHFADFYKAGAIIMDLRLVGGLDGAQMMDRLKSNPATRHIPVHLIATPGDPPDGLTKKGAVGSLSRPVNAGELENVFKGIEDFISKPVKKLLVVEQHETEKKNIADLVAGGDVEAVTAGSGEEAVSLLKKGDFDTMILAPDLPDTSAVGLLERINNQLNLSRLPVIIYSERPLPPAEQEELERYARRIIIKGRHSQERLFAETSLFLHRVESGLPESKKVILNRMIDKESVIQGKTILIVDDDMRNVFALTSILEEKGMNTVVGKNGKEGVEKLESEPGIDLVLMDIMMPVMDGYEAMKTIRKDKRFEKLPIIALTAKAMKGDRHKCVTAGANDYLAKPVDPDKLLSLLRVWLYEQ